MVEEREGNNEGEENREKTRIQSDRGKEGEQRRKDIRRTDI